MKYALVILEVSQLNFHFNAKERNNVILVLVGVVAEWDAQILFHMFMSAILVNLTIIYYF